MPKTSKSIEKKRPAVPLRKVHARDGRTLPAAAPVARRKRPIPTKSSAGRERGRTNTHPTDFIFSTNQTLTLVCLHTDAPVLFSLADAADLTGVHPEMLRYYSRTGLIQARVGKKESELFFDENALHEIRRIEHYRRHLGVGRRALPLICELQREGARQQIELHFLQYPRVPV
jgi:hypothetical protein